MTQVQAYQRVVNGHVVNVNAYSNSATTTTTAKMLAWRKPGRPKVAAHPGSFASGRDIVGMPARSLPGATNLQMQPQKTRPPGPTP